MISFTRVHTIGIGIFFLLVLLVSIGTYYIAERSHFGISDEAKAIFAGDQADPAVYQDLNGNELSLESYLGEVVVVTSWASWSPFSAADLTALNELAAEYDDGPVFLAINRKETKEQALRYLATIADVPNLILVLDPADRFYARIGGYAMPETVVFDQSGQIVLHDRGVLDPASIRTAISGILSE
jgi:thiol-disulfide isomerase/thioredoxin